MDEAVRVLAEVWENFHADQIYRADSLGVIRTGARWLTLFSLGWLIARWRRARPRSLLDNAPAADLLQRMVAAQRLQAILTRATCRRSRSPPRATARAARDLLRRGRGEILPWRARSASRCADIGVQHLMASSAIPFVFPVLLPIEDRTEYFGDGSMRQGRADLAGGAPGRQPHPHHRRRLHARAAGRAAPASEEYPNLAQIAGHAMSNIFLDALAVDDGGLQRINATLVAAARALAHTSLQGRSRRW